MVDVSGGVIERSRLIAMRDAMVCRGPDEVGEWFRPAGDRRPAVALGYRRVSGGSDDTRPPLADETGEVRVVLAGTVYNASALRNELAAAGERFRSRSDAEVLLHGYRRWGLPTLAPRLRGGFAFAIWDGRSGELHLVRDHLGKKPLLFRVRDGLVEFAGDIKSFWIGGGENALDPAAIDEFLYYGAVSQSRTIFRGVQKLPPASWMTFSADGGSGSGQKVRVATHTYWRPDYSRKEQRSVDDWLAELDVRLRQAVRLRLPEDSPPAGFLSGGVDSSTVCALMAQESPARLRTFSVGFDTGDRYDERVHSRAVAAHIGSEHTELVVKPDAAPILSDLVWHYGEPYGDSSAVPTWLISREASGHVSTVLSGDGGDEAFAGYSRHRRADTARRYAWLTPLVTRGLAPLAARLVNLVAPRTLFARNFDWSVKYLAGHPLALAGDTTWFDGWRNALYTPAFRDQLAGVHPLDSQRPILRTLTGPTHVDRALEHQLRTTLPNDYLVKTDIAGSAHALEIRCPMLDVDLLDFASRIPTTVLLADHQPKHLLKRYAATRVPREVIYRKKHGFAVPIRHWLRNEWQVPVRSLLLSKQADRGYFRPRTVANLLDAHAAGRSNHASRIWTLLMLEIWHRIFVDKTLRPGEAVL